MTTVAAILKRKAFRSAVVGPTDPVARIVRILVEEGTEAALVVDQAAQLLGVVTALDVVASLAANGARTLEMTGGQLMTRPRRDVSPATSLSDAMRIMVSSRLRHVPVLDQGRPIGLIGLADLTRALVLEEDRALAA